MGRRKISIAPIQDDRNRSVTFVKRKNGLFKKAHELGVLCSAQVAVIVFNSAGRLFEFSSSDIDGVLFRYSEYGGSNHEKKGPDDYSKPSTSSAKKGLGGKMTTTSDREDDEDEEEEGEDAVSDGDSPQFRHSSARSSISSQHGKTRPVESERSSPPPLVSRTSATQQQQQPQSIRHVPYPPPQQHNQPTQTFSSHAYMNGYPNNQYQQPEHPPPQSQQQWAYSNSNQSSHHPLAGIPPQQQQQQQQGGNWNYQPQGPSGAWGIPPNGYGGSRSEFGSNAPHSGASGMDNGGQMDAIQASYVRAHVIPQKVARAEGCFHEDNADDQYQSRQQEQDFQQHHDQLQQQQQHYSDQQQHYSDVESKPMIPNRASGSGSSLSDSRRRSGSGKPRLSVSIPTEERRGVTLKEGSDGKLFTAEPEGMDDGEESDPQTAVSRFASDLLPSPSGFLNDICYSGYSIGGLNTAVATTATDSQSVFSWPRAVSNTISGPHSQPITMTRSISSQEASLSPISRDSSPGTSNSRATSTPAGGGSGDNKTFRPAPMLSEFDAPDVIRSLKRGSSEGISPVTSFYSQSEEERFPTSKNRTVVGDDGIETDINQLGGAGFVRKNRRKAQA